MSDPFQELMGRMKTAVDKSKTARAHVKTASVEELEEPGDILASTIYGMNDEIERAAFPDEYAAKHAADDLDEDDDGDETDDDPSKIAADAADDDEEDDDAWVDPAASTEEPNKVASLKKEAGFGLSVEADLSNPIVAAGFNAELKEHEPVLKEAMAKILALR